MCGRNREIRRIPSTLDLLFQPAEFFSNCNRRPSVDSLTTDDFVLLPSPPRPILKNKEVEDDTEESDSSCISSKIQREHPKKTVRIATPDDKPRCKLAKHCTKTLTDILGPFVEVLSEMASGSSDDWTSEEDGMICLMRTRGGSSAEIAATIERGKRETRQRIRDLKEMAEEGGLSIEILAKLFEEDIKRREKYKALKSSEEAATKHQQHSKTRKCDKETSNDNASSGGEEATNTNKKGKAKAKKQHKPVVISIPSSSSSSSVATESPAPSHAGSSHKQNNGSSSNERTYDYVDVLCSMYPDHKKLSPDRFYSKRDVRALAALEARFRTDKWLYIAAEFANVTGRMVDAELLKYKFGAEDEDEDEED
ncbi:hypothetical protein F4776DRAFT_674230 [Hypoxylon sp. NC0597]|nr:hypothetical protein F4776DRAFT_674230 [Hypoxylon sp. NC0597]